MTDWMNQLEDELGGMAAKAGSRDLTAAAMCAHRDSKVLAAKRLQQELDPAELEAAFRVLDEHCPGLLASDTTTAGSVALAFVKTSPTGSPTSAPVSPNGSGARGSLASRMVMAIALAVCFGGGLAIGFGSRPASVSGRIATQLPESVQEPGVAMVEEDRAAGVETIARAEPPLSSSSTTVRAGLLRTRFKKSSRPDMTRAYLKMRDAQKDSSY